MDDLLAELSYLERRLLELRSNENMSKDDLVNLLEDLQLRLRPFIEKGDSISEEDSGLQDLLNYRTCWQIGPVTRTWRWLLALRFRADYLPKWRTQGQYLQDVENLLLKVRGITHRL